MTDHTKSTPGAMRAAKALLWNRPSPIRLRFASSASTAEPEIARIIDRETGAAKMLEALIYAEIELRKSSNIETRLMVEKAIAAAEGK